MSVNFALRYMGRRAGISLGTQHLLLPECWDCAVLTKVENRDLLCLLQIESMEA